jgi:AraC-like DNA-binding protein
VGSGYDEALLVIDVQESFAQRESWQAVSNPDIVRDVSELVSAARRTGDRVVWIPHSEPGSGTVFDPVNGHVRLLDGLSVADGEPVLTKTSRNAFTTTNLQQLLTEASIRELVVCGIQTEQCCETTARVAERLPLAEIAGACDVSPRTLTRLFTTATGMTPLRYQQTLRLERAENLIAHGSTVEAAARSTGFDDARMLRRLRARLPSSAL